MVRGKPRNLRRRYQHGKCCGIILKNIAAAINMEDKKKKLYISISRPAQRAIFYSGLPKSTYYHVLKLLEAPEVERKRRSHKMSVEDEAKIRPVIINLVSRKITPTLTNITKELNRVHSNVSCFIH